MWSSSRCGDAVLFLGGLGDFAVDEHEGIGRGVARFQENEMSTDVFMMCEVIVAHEMAGDGCECTSGFTEVDTGVVSVSIVVLDFDEIVGIEEFGIDGLAFGGDVELGTGRHEVPTVVEEMAGEKKSFPLVEESSQFCCMVLSLEENDVASDRAFDEVFSLLVFRSTNSGYIIGTVGSEVADVELLTGDPALGSLGNFDSARGDEALTSTVGTFFEGGELASTVAFLAGSLKAVLDRAADLGGGKASDNEASGAKKKLTPAGPEGQDGMLLSSFSSEKVDFVLEEVHESLETSGMIGQRESDISKRVNTLRGIKKGSEDGLIAVRNRGPSARAGYCFWARYGWNSRGSDTVHGIGHEFGEAMSGEHLRCRVGLEEGWNEAKRGSGLSEKLIEGRKVSNASDLAHRSEVGVTKAWKVKADASVCIILACSELELPRAMFNQAVESVLSELGVGQRFRDSGSVSLDDRIMTLEAQMGEVFRHIAGRLGKFLGIKTTLSVGEAGKDGDFDIKVFSSIKHVGIDETFGIPVLAVGAANDERGGEVDTSFVGNSGHVEFKYLRRFHAHEFEKVAIGLTSEDFGLSEHVIVDDTALSDIAGPELDGRITGIDAVVRIFVGAELSGKNFRKNALTDGSTSVKDDRIGFAAIVTIETRSFDGLSEFFERADSLSEDLGDLRGGRDLVFEKNFTKTRPDVEDFRLESRVVGCFLARLGIVEFDRALDESAEFRVGLNDEVFQGKRGGKGMDEGFDASWKPVKNSIGKDGEVARHASPVVSEAKGIADAKNEGGGGKFSEDTGADEASGNDPERGSVAKGLGSGIGC